MLATDTEAVSYISRGGDHWVPITTGSILTSSAMNGPALQRVFRDAAVHTAHMSQGRREPSIPKEHGAYGMLVYALLLTGRLGSLPS